MLIDKSPKNATHQKDDAPLPSKKKKNFSKYKKGPTQEKKVTVLDPKRQKQIEARRLRRKKQKVLISLMLHMKCMYRLFHYLKAIKKKRQCPKWWITWVYNLCAGTVFFYKGCPSKRVSCKPYKRTKEDGHCCTFTSKPGLVSLKQHQGAVADLA